MNSQTAIQINHLTKSFASNQVIVDCSMRVERGTIYGFLGANGAGKTTIFKLLTGLLTPDSGTIWKSIDFLTGRGRFAGCYIGGAVHVIKQNKSYGGGINESG